MSSTLLIYYLITIINSITITVCINSSSLTLSSSLSSSVSPTSSSESSSSPTSVVTQADYSGVINDTIVNRIVGGKPINIEHIPFIVSIQWRHEFLHHCGGSYIKPNYVLTAAHCLVRSTGKSWIPEEPSSYVVMAGSSDLGYSATWQIRNVKWLHPHPQFTFHSMTHDIGIVKLVKPFRMTRYVNLLPLPTKYDHALFSEPKTCSVSGWGLTNNHNDPIKLRHAEVPLMPMQDCKKLLGPSFSPEQICAGKPEGGIDACQGDSGSPLLCYEVQVGIVSWGYGCAQPLSPGAYTRVDLYLTWIQTYTRSASSATKILCSPISIAIILYFFHSLILNEQQFIK